MLSTSLSYGSAPEQMYERFGSSSDGRATIVLIHGGYWRAQHDREHMRPLALTLAELGWPVVLAEYRRSPHLPHETLIDINALLTALSAETLILIGFSVGGQLALLTSGKHANIQQVIALAPVTDLVATEKEELGEGAVGDWLHAPARNHPELDPTFSGSFTFPVTIFHGTSDVRVPIDQSRRYTKAQSQSGSKIRLIEIEGGGHFELVDPSHPYFVELLNALPS